MPGWLRRLLGRPEDDARSRAADPGRSPQSEPSPAPTPLPRPEPQPGPAEPVPEPPPPPAATSRTERIIHVHADRLDERPGPRRLTPSEALTLASDGPEALRQDREGR